MEIVKNKFEGTWTFVSSEDEDQFMKDCGYTEAAADKQRESRVTFQYAVANNHIQAWSIPFPEKTDEKIEIPFELGKVFKFSDPVTRANFNVITTLNGEDLVEILTPVSNDKAKKTKVVLTRVGDTLEAVYSLIDDPSKRCKKVFAKC